MACFLSGNLELCPGADVDVKDFQNNWLPGKINGLQGSSVREEREERGRAGQGRAPLYRPVGRSDRSVCLSVG